MVAALAIDVADGVHACGAVASHMVPSVASVCRQVSAGFVCVEEHVTSRRISCDRCTGGEAACVATRFSPPTTVHGVWKLPAYGKPRAPLSSCWYLNLVH